MNKAELSKMAMLVCVGGLLGAIQVQRIVKKVLSPNCNNTLENTNQFLGNLVEDSWFESEPSTG